MPTEPAPAAPIAHALLAALVRKLLTMVGTFAVTRGLIDQGTVDGGMAEAVELVIGTVTLGASAAWTWFSTTDVHARLEAALAALRGQPEPSLATPPKIA